MSSLFLRFPSLRRHSIFPLLLVGLAGFVVPLIAQEAEPSTEPTTEEQNPVEQLPAAPTAKDAAAKRAAPGETAIQPAKAVQEPERAAVEAGSTPATPGALVPDEGWDILDAPRQNPTANKIAAPPAEKPSPVSSESLRAIVTRMNLALPLSQGRIVIDKSERRLDLYNGSTLVKSYRVALGKNPFGHKMREGDGRTPEGDFYICTRNAKNSAFHIFLGLSYPALPDAKRAAESNQITPREYQVIRQRLASRGRPPWETNLGGWVGIHGGTDANFAQKKMQQRGTRDWTAGCIALTNREIEELHAATRLGTPVHVQP